MTDDQLTRRSARERAVDALNCGEPLRRATGYGERRVSELEAAGLLVIDPQAGTDALLDAIFGRTATAPGAEPVDLVRQRVETALAAWITDPARLRAVAGDVLDLAQRTLLGEVEGGHPWPREVPAAELALMDAHVAATEERRATGEAP